VPGKSSQSSSVKQLKALLSFFKALGLVHHSTHVSVILHLLASIVWLHKEFMTQLDI